jgi:hypothetical protein
MRLTVHTGVQVLRRGQVVSEPHVERASLKLSIQLARNRATWHAGVWGLREAEVEVGSWEGGAYKGSKDEAGTREGLNLLSS